MLHNEYYGMGYFEQVFSKIVVWIFPFTEKKILRDKLSLDLDGSASSLTPLVQLKKSVKLKVERGL